MLALLLAAPLPAHAQDITTGLVGHWKLDETSGSTITDSGTGNTNGTWSDGSGNDVAQETEAGPVGSALNFDGVDDVVDVSGTNYLTNTNTVTMTAWIKPQSFGFADGIVFGRTTTNDAIGVTYSSSVSSITHSWGNNFHFNYGLTPSFNEWSFIAMVVEPTQITMYMKEAGGTLQSSVNTGFSPPADTLDNLKIGKDDFGGGRFFDGSIDDVRVYNRSLTADDIAVLASGTVKGSIRYNDASEAIEYHSGTEWVHAGLGSYSPNAVTFDGTNDGIEYTGGGYADSKLWTGSFWVRRNAVGVEHNIVDTDGNDIDVRFQADNTLRIKATNTSGSTALLVSGNAIADTDWHHVMFSFDMSDTAKRHIYIDDASALNSVTTYNDEVLDFTNPETEIGATTGGTLRHNGDIADFWMVFGTYIDLSVQANREKFISANGVPMYLGADGSLPLGKQPDIFLSGDTATWHTNKGTGGGFTENGALEDALDRPFAATWRSASTTHIQKLASDAAADDELGSVSAYGTVNGVAVDGMYAAIGAPGAGTAGAVYIFHTETGAELHKIDAPAGSDINFGYGVALEGSNLVVGAAGNCGADLYVYDINVSTTTPQVSITAGLNNCNGWDVDISGNKFIAGTRNGTSAYVYDVNDGTLLHTLNAAVGGGGATRAVAIDGDWALVGNPLFDNGGSTDEGRAYLYDLSACGASCTETHALTIAGGAAGDFLGWGVAIDGDYAAVSSPDNVRVYTFDVKTGTELLTIAPSASAGDAFSDFGGDIAIDNKVMAVSQGRGGTNRTGRLEVFDVVTGTSLYSLQNPTGTPSEDRFAASIDLDDDVIAVGHPYEDTAASNAGAAWIVTNKPCASPDGRIGDIFYNTDEKVLQYCNGVDWVAMGPVSGSGGNGCFNPDGNAGDIIFNTDYSVLQYCNDEDWVGIGTGQDATALGGLIGHWTLDETTGSTITDSSGNGNNGTWSDGVNNDVAEETSAGKIGTALTFDGVAGYGGDDAIDLGTTDILTGRETSFTICSWVNLETYATASEYTIYKRIDGSLVGGFLFQADSNSQWGIETNNGAWQTHYANTRLTLNQWEHICAVNDAGTLYFYLNGASDGSSAYTQPSNVAGLNQAISGGSAGAGPDGALDDVRIYNRALTAPQVLDIYQSGNNFAISDDLSHHWPLDETSGSSITDIVGGLTGTWDDGENNDVAEETVSAKVGTGLNFDGNDEIDTAATFNVPQVGTIAMWVQFDSDLGTTHRFFGSDNNFEITKNSSDQIDSDILEGSGTSPSTTVVTTGVWYHVAVAYDGTADISNIYINGALEVTGGATGTPPTPDSLGIGQRDGTNNELHGTLDDVRIYNRMLTAGEVLTLYNATNSPGCASGGAYIGGSCWYYSGTANESCTTMCTNLGLAYDAATLNYAGSSGTNGQCQAVLDAVGAPLTGAPSNLGCGAGVGCQVTTDPFRERCTSPATTAGASDTEVRRVCACQ